MNIFSFILLPFFLFGMDEKEYPADCLLGMSCPLGENCSFKKVLPKANLPIRTFGDLYSKIHEIVLLFERNLNEKYNRQKNSEKNIFVKLSLHFEAKSQKKNYEMSSLLGHRSKRKNSKNISIPEKFIRSLIDNIEEHEDEFLSIPRLENLFSSPYLRTFIENKLSRRELCNDDPIGYFRFFIKYNFFEVQEENGEVIEEKISLEKMKLEDIQLFLFSKLRREELSLIEELNNGLKANK